MGVQIHHDVCAHECSIGWAPQVGKSTGATGIDRGLGLLLQGCGNYFCPSGHFLYSMICMSMTASQFHDNSILPSTPVLF